MKKSHQKEIQNIIMRKFKNDVNTVYITRRSKHYDVNLILNNGQTFSVVTAGTPSDYRNLKELVASVRRKINRA